jgi:hypothetical protein
MDRSINRLAQFLASNAEQRQVEVYSNRSRDLIITTLYGHNTTIPYRQTPSILDVRGPCLVWNAV